MSVSALNARFAKEIDAADPATTIAYFWPDPPTSLIERAKARGLITVREMINCYRGTAKRILDAAYAEQGLEPAHGITEASVEVERRQLQLYDYVFSPYQVEPSLAEAGVERSRILPAAFGWSPKRFSAPHVEQAHEGVTVLFVGTVSIRKGVPHLLEAWKRSGVVGRLKLVGGVMPEMKPWVERYAADPTVEFISFTTSIQDIYHRSDIFVFPTLEEGSPQVAPEAAGCGLPLILTPMAAGRILRHGENGLLVQPGDIDGLAAAIADLAASPDKRSAFGRQAASDAANFTYERLAQDRAKVLASLVSSSHREGPRIQPSLVETEA